MIKSIEFAENKKDNVITVICDDGFVSMDKRVYEQKLGTLLSCQTTQQIYEVAVSSTNYLEEHYKTKDIVKPVRW
jgi:hypothetical protein